ncbi:MAG: DUF3108 domain-containing protein [Gammaproteobacteria bacterium]|nr:DUF3108 domain-containing protein [Gammaproteobacteria bacterium]
MNRLVSVLILLLVPIYLSAQEIPDFSANYLVKLNGLQAGQLKRSLVSNPNGTRTFKSETQAKGIFAFFKPDLVEEMSVWRHHNTLIRPESYLYQRTGGKKDKYLSLDFDWQKSQVHIDDHKQPWTLSIEENTLDKLVYQISLMSDLADNKSQFSYRIADGGKLKTYKIDILTTETVTTPLGKIDAIKLIRHRAKSKGRQTILWCAPSLNYLPIMLEHTEKGGSVFTAVLRRLDGIETKGAFEKIETRSPAFVTH